MKRNSGLFLFALCPLIPATSRLAYALVMAGAMVFYYLTGIICREAIRRIEGLNSGNILELVCLAGASALYSSILRALYPLLATSLELYVYAAAFSFLLLLSIDSFNHTAMKMPQIIVFVPVFISFAGLRELIGCGTVSLPSPSGLIEIDVFGRIGFSVIRFWGTTAGALLLAGFFTWLFRLLFSGTKKSGGAS